MSENLKKISAKLAADTMNDDPEDMTAKRKFRNMSEKKRRDDFNTFINDLSEMVSTGGKKMDKSTVLKHTITYLGHHKEIAELSCINEVHQNWKPKYLPNEEFTHLILESTEAFIIVFGISGEIFYASESITSLLGHLPADLLCMSIYELVSEDEHFYNKLVNSSDDEGHVAFSCYLRRRSSDNNSPECFELVHFVGYFRSDKDIFKTDNRYSGYSGEADTRLVFVGTGRLQNSQPIREIPLIDSSNTVFVSEHNNEWKFLTMETCASPIIGYLPFELLGTSGFDYYHVDDLDSIFCWHEAILRKGKANSGYYRFLTKGQQWIWLQTEALMSLNQFTSKPDHIRCTHRVVSYVDVLGKTQYLDEGSSQRSHNLVNRPLSRSNNFNCNKSSNSGQHAGGGSDCTSNMSADSPASHHSAMTQHSLKTQSSSQNKPIIRPQQLPQQPSPSLLDGGIFLEPQQYVAAIPLQPLIATFDSSTFTSSTVDNLVEMSPAAAQSQIQLDLQRKQAELQAAIGQQQAELRKVSEQLWMARVGLLSPASNQSPTPSSTNMSLSYQECSPENVSSTTTMSIEPIQTESPSLLIPMAMALPQQQQQQLEQQQQQNILYNPPDSSSSCSK